MEYKKKLIEVALPLVDINRECAREKSIKAGHPSSLHQYWARRPLAAARVAIIASIIDDPSSDESLSENEADEKRDKLFSLLKELVVWGNHKNQKLIDEISLLIKKSNEELPSLLDPFCGGGSIPIEAQRLGLKAIASDLNPLAVFINKVIIESSVDFVKTKPINPDDVKSSLFDMDIPYNGLKSDIKYYANWLIKEAYKNKKYYFPSGPNNEKVLSWFWVREIICPNPNCLNKTPLVKSFMLINNKRKKVWLNPKIKNKEVVYEICDQINRNVPSGTVKRTGAECFICKNPISLTLLRELGQNKKITQKIACLYVEHNQKKYFIEATKEHQSIYDKIQLNDKIPDSKLPEKALGFRVQNYGIKYHKDLFNKRQLLILQSFYDLLGSVKEKIENEGGSEAYSKCIISYIALIIGRFSDYASTMTFWDTRSPSIQKTFSLPTIFMRFEYAETNPFGSFSGNIYKMIKNVVSAIESYPLRPKKGIVFQQNATEPHDLHENVIYCTDPPYYDNIGYSSLSDYFYIWLKYSLGKIYPELFNTILAPKVDELIAEPHRHGSKELASLFFDDGMSKFFKKVYNTMNPNYPITLFYAFKQSETKDGNVWSTGWETFLNGLINNGFMITGTWPIRTEQTGGLRTVGRNALASSVLVICRKRIQNTMKTRKEFVSELSSVLESSILHMMKADITPVDLQQSAIGPGMSIFSKYAKILEADGSTMTVRTALQLINAELDRVQENSDIEMDSDTRFCIQWFDTYGFDDKPYGEAETLAQAKDISVDGLVNAGVFSADSGKAKLKYWIDMPADWDPRLDKRLTLWECTHHLVRELIEGDGQLGAARLAKYMGNQKADEAKELAYQLYHICDKRSWAKHAADYNTLVSNWADIKSQIPNVGDEQETLF